jgi:hypothetical protein
MKIDLEVKVPSDRVEYVMQQARMRDISVVELMDRTMAMVLQSKMFLAVLDDGGLPEKTTLVPALPAPPLVSRRVSLKKRCELLVEKIRQHGGRLCRADIGDSGETMKWQAAITKLIADNVIYSLPPQPGVKRVYYALVAGEVKVHVVCRDPDGVATHGEEVRVDPYVKITVSDEFSLPIPKVLIGKVTA